MGMPVVDLARTLRRDERTVRDWLSGKQRMPCWVPEYMRLRQMEQAGIRRQMNMTALGPRLGIVRGDVVELAVRRPKKSRESLICGSMTSTRRASRFGHFFWDFDGDVAPHAFEHDEVMEMQYSQRPGLFFVTRFTPEAPCRQNYEKKY